MDFIKEITAELTGEMLFESITAVQGDSGRKIKVVLLANNQPYEIPDGATAAFRATKPDKTLILNDCEIDEDGAIIAGLTPQTLAVCGNVRCQISLYGTNGEVLTSVPFIVKVVSKSAADREIKSTNEFNALEEANEIAEAARETATEALNTVEEVEASVGAATGAALEAAENANDAADSANSATKSANNAADKANKAAKRADDSVVTHEWDGTTLIVTSSSGTSSADLKGERGERGYSGLVPKVTADIASGEVQVSANTMTVIAELTGETTVALGAEVEGYDNEWDFTITQGATAQTLALPVIQWGLGIAPTFSANTTTICRLYYIGNTLCGEWSVVNNA